MLDVKVRFDPTYYTTTESKGSVTVWIHVDEGVTEPFTVALIPGEGDVKDCYESKSLFFWYAGFEKSDHYKLDCNARLGFNSSIRSLFHTYDITRDETCDSQFGRRGQEGVDLFKVNLVLVSSTDPLVEIDFDNAEATVFIDDMMEDECSEFLCI